MDKIIFLIIITVLCLIILLLILRQKTKYDGVLYIDTTDPEKDIFRLELNTLIGIENKKQIILKVETHEQL